MRGRRRLLWAPRGMDECRVQRIAEFVLVRQYTAANCQWDRSVGPIQPLLAQPPPDHIDVATSATSLSSSLSALSSPAPTAASATYATTRMATVAA